MTEKKMIKDITCEQFPIAEEDIIFEQEIEKFKRIDH